MKKKSYLSVLAGVYKGRKLHCPENVRPLTGLCKKSLFDILTARLPGAAFLDIFSGTGSVGIEALSRGAAFAAFVEKEGEVVDILQENLKKINIPPEKYRVYQQDAGNFLAMEKGEYDIIFIGPPYNLALPGDFLDKTFRILKPGGIVISQHATKARSIPDHIPFRTKKFGITTLDFYENAKNPHSSPFVKGGKEGDSCLTAGRNDEKSE